MHYSELPYRERKNFNSIDLMKFIMAWFVVIIHLRPFRLMNPVYTFIFRALAARTAVPFFVIASSFFLFRKMSPDAPDFKSVWAFVLRMFRLFGIWTVLLFVGGTPQLWYLPSMAIGILLLYALVRIKTPAPLIAVLGCGMYLFSAFGLTYYYLAEETVLHYFAGIYGIVPQLFREGIFFCFPFAVIGMFFAFNDISLPKPALFTAFVVSALAYIADAYLVNNYGFGLDVTSYITLPPIMFFMFLIVLNIELPDSPKYRRLRNMSVLIYLLHIIVRYLAASLLMQLGAFISFDFESPPLIMLVTVIILLPLCRGIDRLADKEKYKFLRTLYS